jgi:hypothetical protein
MPRRPRWCRSCTPRGRAHARSSTPDGLREPGFSKERRLDSQITIGWLSDAAGFPLRLGARPQHRRQGPRDPHLAPRTHRAAPSSQPTATLLAGPRDPVRPDTPTPPPLASTSHRHSSHTAALAPPTDHEKCWPPRDSAQHRLTEVTPPRSRYTISLTDLNFPPPCLEPRGGPLPFGCAAGVAAHGAGRGAESDQRADPSPGWTSGSGLGWGGWGGQDPAGPGGAGAG